VIRIRKQARQKGFALVLVLWILSLLTIMAGSFALTMRREASIIEGIKNNAQAMAVAESGIAIAEMMMLIPDAGRRWRADSSVYQINFENGKVRIRLLSETGKIDLNTADQALLQALISHAPIDEGQQTGLVNAILDWRDEDDLVREDGAEKKEYQDAGLSYQPRNKPFQDVEELQLVLGMNESVYDWLQGLITVYSKGSTINLQLASPEVLQVLPDLDEAAKDEYMQARRERSVNALKSASPFNESSSLGETGENAAPVADSGAVTIISEAQLDDGSTAVINAIIARSNSDQQSFGQQPFGQQSFGQQPFDQQPTGQQSSPFQILKWQRNYAGNDSLFSDEMSELLVTEYAEPQFDN
jgi:general secretion pathway protein K